MNRSKIIVKRIRFIEIPSFLQPFRWFSSTWYCIMPLLNFVGVVEIWGMHRNIIKSSEMKHGMTSYTLLAIIDKYDILINQWSWLFEALSEASTNKIALWINICEDDWTAGGRSLLVMMGINRNVLFQINFFVTIYGLVWSSSVKFIA